MNAPACSQGSYAWKSLLKGREVLRKGLRWRIGTGDLVNLWSDPWLPSTIQPPIQSPVAHDFANAKVCSIINPSQKSWDVALLNRLFLPHEALLIQSIPLSLSPIEDKLVWPLNPSEIYSVKSGYKLLSQEVGDAAFINHVVDPAVWKVVWGLKVQNKIRNFLWRAIRNSIPVKSNLMQRKVLTIDSCDHCLAEPEGILHALWNCPLLDPMWNFDPIWSFRSSSQFLSFADLVQYLIKENLNLRVVCSIVLDYLVPQKPIED